MLWSDMRATVSYTHLTGITRQRAAEVVAEMFGTEAYYDGTTYGVWSVIDLEGKKWKFMSDGSIRCV